MRSKRVEQFSKVMIHHGWRSMSILSSPKDWANPFDIEVWAKGGRVMLAQIWSDGSGVATYFEGGGSTWEQLEVELARDTHLPPADAPCPELVGAKPLVLYFTDDKERDEFVALVKEAKPNLVSKPL